jgi:hypothetical protein
MTINITLTEIITSLLLYGIVHGIWVVMRYLVNQLETETGRIIHTHVREGHSDRFKQCLTGDCATRLGTWVSQPKAQE